MGMNPAEFWSMSWRDFGLKQRGFFELRNAEYRTQWEQSRFVAFYSFLGMAKKNSLKRVTDLVRFDWEKDEVKLPTKEEMRYWLLKYGKTTEMN